MPIITIRGQYGSGTTEIGKLIAEKLNIDYVDREIISEVAQRLRRPSSIVEEKEMPPSTLLGRIAEAMANTYMVDGIHPGIYLPTWEIPLNDSSYVTGLESVIKELAGSQSVVIRGRGSQFILKDFSGVFHVMIVAPSALRIKRVMESSHSDEENARNEISRFEKGSREFVKRYFHAEYEDPVHYDLVINTGHLDFEAAASIVVAALPLKDRAVGVGKRAD